MKATQLKKLKSKALIISLVLILFHLQKERYLQLPQIQTQENPTETFFTDSMKNWQVKTSQKRKNYLGLNESIWFEDKQFWKHQKQNTRRKCSFDKRSNINKNSSKSFWSISSNDKIKNKKQCNSFNNFSLKFQNQIIIFMKTRK